MSSILLSLTKGLGWNKLIKPWCAIKPLIKLSKTIKSVYRWVSYTLGNLLICPRITDRNRGHTWISCFSDDPSIWGMWSKIWKWIIWHLFFFWIIFSYFYCRLFTFLGGFTHSVHWGINPPSQKKISLFFAKPPPPLPWICKLPKLPLFRQSPLYIGFSWTPPPPPPPPPSPPPLIVKFKYKPPLAWWLRLTT